MMAFGISGSLLDLTLPPLEPVPPPPGETDAAKDAGHGDSQETPPAPAEAPTADDADGESPSESDEVLALARRLLEASPAAISGQNGHHTMFSVCLDLVMGLLISHQDAFRLILAHYNSRCREPWTKAEIHHKLTDAAKSTEVERGYLLNGAAERKIARMLRHPGQTLVVMEQLRREGLAIVDKNGDYQVLRRPMAYRRILELDERFHGQFRRNAMGLRDYFGALEIRDETVTSILNELDQRYRLAGDVNHLDRQVAALCAENTFHPVRVYLDALPPWDGQDRIPLVLKKVLGAKASELNRAMLACWYIGAVARVFRPGCKMDTALVLKSTVQGNHKTTFFPAHTEAIPGAFLEGHEDFQSKDGILSLHTCWIAELGEIDRITRKRDAEQVKNFLSKQADRIRMPYGRRTIEMPRGFVVAGTTNSAGFLVDTTGHRRFFVIETGDGKFDLDLLRGMVPQLWAQAMAEFRAGKPWWLDSKMEDQHSCDMRAFEIEEPWVELVLKSLADIKTRRHDAYPKRFLAEGVTVAELLQVMGVKAEQHHQAHTLRVAEILRNHDWTKKENQVRDGITRLRLWFPPQNEILEELADN